MSKSWLDSNRKPIESSFDIKSYRSQLKDKISPCFSITSDPQAMKFSTTKKETQATQVPSFDNLQARIRDFSYSRLGNSLRNLQDHPLSAKGNAYSPHKATGMQHKITDALGPKQPKNYSPYKSNTQSALGNPSGTLTSSTYRPYKTSSFQLPESRPLQLLGNLGKTQNRRNLADTVQLNEIVNLRNKIEQSYVNKSQLTSTYATELIKLAQSITSALKSD